MAWIAVGVLGVALGAWQRWVAVEELPPDFDELIYIPVAYDYARDMAPGRWGEIPAYRGNLEHPPLVKLMFATELKATGAPEPNWKAVQFGSPLPPAARGAFRATRRLSWVAGVAQLAILAVEAPIAALGLAFSTYDAKFTAQAYLEAVPGLFAILAVVLFERSVRKREAPAAPSCRVSFVLSAVLLGLAGAGKYPYALVVGLTVALFLVIRLRRRPAWWAAYVGIALLTLFVADPFLWPDPLHRIPESVGYHWGYSSSEQVRLAGMPWFQPVFWLTHAGPMMWHPGVFFTPLADWALLPLAVVGFGPALKRRPIWATWAAIGMAFLFLWPTKWPQYVLLVLPAIAVCAATGVEALGARLMKALRWQRAD